jgi:hypothetical protein
MPSTLKIRYRANNPAAGASIQYGIAFLFSPGTRARDLPTLFSNARHG